eukprot:79816-Rhodomonas_salina.1
MAGNVLFEDTGREEGDERLVGAYAVSAYWARMPNAVPPYAKSVLGGYAVLYAHTPYHDCTGTMWYNHPY